VAWQIPGIPFRRRWSGSRTLRDQGVLDEKAYQEMLYAVQGGHDGATPGGTKAAVAARDAPPIVIHRV